MQSTYAYWMVALKKILVSYDIAIFHLAEDIPINNTTFGSSMIISLIDENKISTENAINEAECVVIGHGISMLFCNTER